MASDSESSEVESSVESDAVESDWGLEPHRVQEQQDIGSDSGVTAEEQPDVEEGVVAQPTQSGLGLESPSVQEKDTIDVLESLQAASNLYNLGNTGRIDGEADNGIQANSAAAVQQTQAAVQQTQAGLGLGSHSFQEQQPNVEKGTINVVAVQPAQAGLGLEPRNIQEQSNVNKDATPVFQGVLTAFNRHYLNNSDWIDGEVRDDIQAQNDRQEMQDQEEDNGIQARTGNQQMQDGPPQQGTAGRRMRLQVSSLHSVTEHEGNILGLQLSDAISRCNELYATFREVPLGGSKGQRKWKSVSIEGTCMYGRMSVDQETGKVEDDTEGGRSASSMSHAFTSNQSILNVEGNTKKPICAELDHSNVVQQTPPDVSGSSSTPRLRSLTSLVNLLLGLLGDVVSCLHLQPSCPLRWRK